MSPLQSSDFGFSSDLPNPPEPFAKALQRRFSGRYAIDPFGLDPQLCDLTAPLVTPFLRLEGIGLERIPPRGPAVLVANRGLGLGEPLALAVAVRRAGRRLRIVGPAGVPLAGEVLRRLGVVNASPQDVGAVLRAGHVVAVPLAPTWLQAGAGAPPLPLVAAMMGVPVLPVAVRPRGPLGTSLLGWQVQVGRAVPIDSSYLPGDPLGAAELAEAARLSVDRLLAGEEPGDGGHPAATRAAG